MPGVKVRVHPLCLLVGVLSALTGTLLPFLSAILAAALHECAHAFAARRYGFALDTLVLMPYGATIAGDIGGIGKKEGLCVLLAGPLANAATALAFVALWWLYPETYPYTDTAAYVSASLCLVNLLPAWPLDGGRILHLALSPLGEVRSMRIVRAVTFLLAAGVLAFFVWSCFSSPAWTALAFAVLLAAGAFGGGRYAPLKFSRKKSLARGMSERRIVISAGRPVRAAFRYLREESYLVLVLYEGGEFVGEVTEEEYLAAVQRGDWALPLSQLLPKL